MKRIITLITMLSLLLALLTIGASAENATAKSEEIATAYVTIAVKGELVTTQLAVVLQDLDGDGSITVNDALCAAHEKAYTGGAAAGYGYYESDYGLSMSKLWGDESGAYGYYLNNAFCQSLADPIKDGDRITAFVYASADFSDVYTYFDVSAKTISLGEEITLTLMAAGYDENWNPITYPVEGATLTFGGNKTGFVTDAEGKVTVTPDTSGAHTYSAVHGEMAIVPPACVITVNKPESGCKAITGSVIGLVTLLGCAMIRRREK